MKLNKVALAISCVGLLLSASCSHAEKKGEPTLKEALKDKFLIGTAMDSVQIIGVDTAGVRVIRQQFNSIVAENCMKAEVVHPQPGKYDFTLADKFVEFGEKNQMTIIGHTLIWHSQLPRWFCTDEKGKNVTPDVLKERMREHISTVVGRYKGRIKGWDVVNEAILDDGAFRQSKFYEILGEEFIPLAFRYAHEADPDAELYYNDYSMSNSGKREAVVKMVHALKEQGIRIDAVGMQGHIGMDYPAIEAFEKSMLAFASTGAKVMITELDLTILPIPDKNVGAEVSSTFEYKKEMNPYVDGLPEEKSKEWNDRMGDFFRLFLKHKEIVTRVTVWGVSDGDSWRNYWPVFGRTDYPLLFDRNHQPKPVVATILAEAMK